MNLGVAVLGMVLLISLAAVFAFLIVPLLLRSTRRRGHHSRHLIYFIAVGLGYILIEIAFIQRFVLFLGHPTYALTVVIFLMLLSSGAGSLLSRRWVSSPAFGWRPLSFVITVILIYVFFLPSILNALVGLPFVAKLVVSGALLIPLGLAMGMPFPTGLRALTGRISIPGEAGAGDPLDNAVEWAWAMNAASSVLGSVLAIVIAIHFGLNTTLASGGVAYCLALACSYKLHRSF